MRINKVIHSITVALAITLPTKIFSQHTTGSHTEFGDALQIETFDDVSYYIFVDESLQINFKKNVINVFSKNPALKTSANQHNLDYEKCDIDFELLNVHKFKYVQKDVPVTDGLGVSNESSSQNSIILHSDKILINSFFGSHNCVIYNAQGNVVRFIEFVDNVDIPLIEFNSGIYILSIDGISSIKFIK